jgi:uncharacterized protein
VLFYLITISIAFIQGFVAAYMGNNKGLQQFQMPLLLLGLCVPCIIALIMIYQNEILIEDFWHRLLLFKFKPVYLIVILFLMPCVIFLATWLSLHFGYSTEQFQITKELSVMKGWAILGIAIPLVLAPIIEELGWRGYGVDSLKAYFNLFNASVLFGVLWAVWHIPAFFVKGYYHNQLWHQNIFYVINFFAGVFVIAFLMNWVYYKTGRSIPAVILFHAVVNLSSMLLKTEQFTKCIATALLCIFTIFVIVYDRDFFFTNGALPMIRR